MDTMDIRPEKEQLSMWFIGWSIPTVIGTVFWGFMIAFFPENETPKLVWILCLAVFVTVMILIAVWIPAFYKSLEYTVEGDCVKMKRGVFWKKSIAVPFTKITNVDVTQGPLQRAFNIAAIAVQTAGAGGAQGARPELSIIGVRNFDEIKNTIMDRVKGFKNPKSDFSEQVVAKQNSEEILPKMLAELSAIRQLLEKNS